jgi:uncharacterized protein YdaU (DUF1376 family)
MAKEPTLSMLPWFPRDYLAATRGMTLAERGAYTDLLWFAWDMGTLPNDPKRLARMLGVDADEFSEVWPAIQSKFVLTETGGIENKRLERERRYSVEMRKKALARAQSGGKATKEKWEKDPEGMAASLATSRATSQATSPDLRGLQARLEQGSPIPNPQSPSKAPAPSQSLRRGEDPRRGEPTEAPTVEPLNPRAAAKAGNGKTPEQRADAIRAVIKNCPEYKDAEVAHVAHASLDEVQKVRKEGQ